MQPTRVVHLARHRAWSRAVKEGMEDRRTVERMASKVRVGAAGFGTVALGVVLLPLPGPGSIVILTGLTVLGKEFPSAKRLADRGWGAFGRIIKPFRRREGATPRER